MRLSIRVCHFAFQYFIAFEYFCLLSVSNQQYIHSLIQESKSYLKLKVSCNFFVVIFCCLFLLYIFLPQLFILIVTDSLRGPPSYNTGESSINSANSGNKLHTRILVISTSQLAFDYLKALSILL